MKTHTAFQIWWLINVIKLPLNDSSPRYSTRRQEQGVVGGGGGLGDINLQDKNETLAVDSDMEAVQNTRDGILTQTIKGFRIKPIKLLFMNSLRMCIYLYINHRKFKFMSLLYRTDVWTIEKKEICFQANIHGKTLQI